MGNHSTDSKAKGRQGSVKTIVRFVYDRDHLQHSQGMLIMPTATCNGFQ
jgi:hypothetical protein